MFSDLSYEKFRDLAKKQDISKYNKVGFPNDYRKDKEELIFKDMLSKIANLSKTNQKVLDIGPGCSDLPHLFMDLLEKNNSELTLIDSEEMLALLPDKKGVIKYEGMFPDQFGQLIAEKKGYYDVIFLYSVIQYIFKDSDIWKFLDSALIMLNKGGYLFLGDIPNFSMKKRFLSSDEGLKFHRSYYGNDSSPDLDKINPNSEEINDEIVLGIIRKARSKGYHSWIIPQNKELTFSNRREDILIKKP